MIASFGRYVLATSAFAALLVGCAGSQPITGAPAAASQPATHFRAQSLQGYYLATFTTQVGQGLPGSTLCIHFKRSGKWSSSGSENFNGTYAVAGSNLYASGVWLPSPAVELYLAATLNGTQGSGTFIIPGSGQQISGAGTFTLAGAQKGCG